MELDPQRFIWGPCVHCTVGLRDACRHEGNTEEENKGFVVFKRNSTDQRLTANAEVATVLGSIPASSDTVESEGRQMKQC